MMSENGSRTRGIYRDLLLIAALLLGLGFPYSSALAAGLPDQAFIFGVVGHSQHYGLTCEARSASDWAAFWGVSLTEEQILAELPRSESLTEGLHSVAVRRKVSLESQNRTPGLPA